MSIRLSQLGLILGVPLGSVLLVAMLNHLQWFDDWEWQTLDLRTQLRAEVGQPPPDEHLLVIGIGDRSINNIMPWQFRRSWHAQLQQLLAFEAPRVLVWDIIYGNRVDANGTPIDAEADDDFVLTTNYLAEQGISTVFAAVTFDEPTGDDLSYLGATRPLTNINGDLAQIYGDSHIVLPFPGLRESGFVGTVDAPRGAGGIVRRMPMIVRVGDTILPSLTLQSLMRFWELESEDVEVTLGKHIVLGGKANGRTIPIDQVGALLINYRYEPMKPGDELGEEMPTVEYFDVLIDIHQKHVLETPGAKDPVPLEGKIVLVGEYSTDSGTTPRSELTPLVYLHANVLNNVLANDYLRPISAWWLWSAMGLLTMAGAWLSLRRAILWSVVFSFSVSLLIVGGATAVWISGSWWIPVVAPLICFGGSQSVLIVHRVRAEARAKAEMRGMFGSYLSPVVVERMIATGEQPALGGVNEEITAYFSDIQSFSSFSEVLSAPQLVELLNEYLTACTDLIQDAGGTLDKYIGDAVVAMFGAPIEQDDHAYQACVTVLKVQAELDKLREKWISEGDKWPPLVHQMRTRIGLNSGECMIGNMGSRSRFNYTMMGDHVNLAARMESGAKSWGVFNMVTESTREACERVSGNEMVFRPLGKIRVAGRTQPVPIHELVGFRAELNERTFACLAEFDRGLAHYHAQEWDAAAQAFAASEDLEPLQVGKDPGVKSTPSMVYQKIVRKMAPLGVDPDWDGVYTMDSK
ncbi:MAG: adenylate/guanylate cyclase domain-containing protein [Synoicihabitans sp.]